MLRAAMAARKEWMRCREYLGVESLESREERLTIRGEVVGVRVAERRRRGRSCRERESGAW